MVVPRDDNASFRTRSGSASVSSTEHIKQFRVGRTVSEIEQDLEVAQPHLLWRPILDPPGSFLVA